MVFFKTEFQGYSGGGSISSTHFPLIPRKEVKFSPFNDKLVAVATAQNFGIVGNGKQEVHERVEGAVRPVAAFYTQDGLYDCAWSEESEHHLVGVSGDGSVKLWDIRNQQGRPTRAWKEHAQEIYGVDWNVQRKDLFLTGSWDERVKLWTPNSPTSLRTYHEHKLCIYAVAWDPLSADRFASASGDGTVKVWDSRGAASTLSLVHGGEVLSVDWSKYDAHMLVSGSVDKAVRVWDVRQPREPVTILRCHQYAVRRVRTSPHHRQLIASVSYDRCFCLWDLSRPARTLDPLVDRLELHSEFAVGCDFSVFTDGLVASCGWDCKVALWRLGSDPAV